MQIHYEFNERDLGHGASATILHPVVLVAMIVAIVWMLWRPRKQAIVPLFLCIFLFPRGQVIYVGGVHLYVSLILLLAGFILVIRSKFNFVGGLNIVDKVFLFWAAYRCSCITVTRWPDATMEQLSFLLQAYCGYFLLRYLIRSEKDMIRMANTLAIIALVLGVSMVYEGSHLVNLFGTYLGGAPVTPEIRNGIGRAQAVFGHSILAGCFGATLVPFFIWLWTTKGKNRIFAAVGLLGSALIVYTTNSSTPVLALVAGVLGLCLWPIRRHMRVVRWGLVVGLTGLAIVMKAPVWYVIAHINVIGGSGGYDRAFLIDTCMRHIKEWWLIGTNQYAGWGYDMWDLSDQFVAEAETGGIITLACFIAIISLCYSRIGKLRKRVESKEQWLLWCLGSIMLAHIFAYFGVSYWDQNQIWWFAFLAMISAATVPLSQPAGATVPAAAEVSPKPLKPKNPWGIGSTVQAREKSRQKHWILGR